MVNITILFFLELSVKSKIYFWKWDWKLYECEIYTGKVYQKFPNKHREVKVTMNFWRIFIEVNVVHKIIGNEIKLYYNSIINFLLRFKIL